MSFGKVIPLSNGATIPQVGLGTWLSKEKEVENAVEIAIRNGYRHIDCALIYGNQDEVGTALKKVIPSVVKREELFITSKLWNNHHYPYDAEKDLDLTLKQLGVDYLDLYLIHWPVAFPPGDTNYFTSHPSKPEVVITDDTSLIETWKAMIKLPATGKVKAVGVSNFTIKNIKAIAEATGVWPAANQIERHPLLPQYDLIKFCQEHNIHVTAYSPLGNNVRGVKKLIEYDEVKSIADRYGVTSAQVLIAWGVYDGCSVIPKSVHEDRIISNFKQFELTKEQYDAISAIGKENQVRFNSPFHYCTAADPKWDINIFDEGEEKNASHQVVL